MKHLKVLLMATMAVIGLTFTITAPSAAAATADGTQVTCGRSGYGVGLYFNSDIKGSKRCIYGDVSNYAYNGTLCTSQGCPPYRFELDGRNGEGQLVKNNAASVYNYSGYGISIFFGSGWSGPWDSFPEYGYAGSALWYGNLNSTYNENASHRRTAQG
ncbi:hypothetical protein AB0A76_03765 [Streptomyces exfoliatus]|uniref:Peptidase inhibitor family I36 n=1 Tax=Streptomyces exfoliatus TaxID=1905 RepID=A0ABV3CRF1_STREX